MNYPEDYINKVICGDCLEVMKGIPNESIDLVVTSPPFNLGNIHHTGNIQHSPYFDDLPEKDYQDWQINVLDECFRIIKEKGSVLYHHKNRIKNGKQITPYDWLLKTKLIVKQELVWFNGSQNFDKCRFYPMTERIYWLSKSIDTKFYNTINHHDLFKWNSVGTNKEHTRAFPEEMVMDILQCFVDSNIVLDPFLGSGTTAVACKQLNRNFIGIEINQDYCDIANKRLQQEPIRNWINNKN